MTENPKDGNEKMGITIKDQNKEKPILGIERIVFIEPGIFPWRGYGNGVIFHNDDKISIVKEDRSKTQLYEGKFDDYGGYGKGIIIRNGNKFTGINEDGKTIDLYNGEYHQWIGYNNGIIIRYKDRLVAHRESGTEIKLHEGPFDNWGGYGNGTILRHGKRFTLNTENDVIDLDEQDFDQWIGYKNGIILQKGKKFTAVREDMSKTCLYEGKYDRCNSYGNGLLIANNIGEYHDGKIIYRLSGYKDPRCRAMEEEK